MAEIFRQGKFSLGKVIRNLAKISSIFPDEVFPFKVFNLSLSTGCALKCWKMENGIARIFDFSYGSKNILTYLSVALICVSQFLICV